MKKSNPESLAAGCTSSRRAMEGRKRPWSKRVRFIEVL